MRTTMLTALVGATALLATALVPSAARADPPWARDGYRHGPPPWAPAHGWRRKHEYGGFRSDDRGYRPSRYRERRDRGGDWD